MQRWNQAHQALFQLHVFRRFRIGIEEYTITQNVSYT